MKNRPTCLSAEISWRLIYFKWYIEYLQQLKNMAIWVQNKLIKLPSSCSLCEAGCNDAAIHMLLYMLANLKYMGVHANAIYSNPNPMRVTPSPQEWTCNRKIPRPHAQEHTNQEHEEWLERTNPKETNAKTYIQNARINRNIPTLDVPLVVPVKEVPSEILCTLILYSLPGSQ